MGRWPSTLEYSLNERYFASSCSLRGSIPGTSSELRFYHGSGQIGPPLTFSGIRSQSGTVSEKDSVILRLRMSEKWREHSGRGQLMPRCDQTGNSVMFTVGEAF